jgi:hypothetical protein
VTPRAFRLLRHIVLTLKLKKVSSCDSTSSSAGSPSTISSHLQPAAHQVHALYHNENYVMLLGCTPCVSASTRCTLRRLLLLLHELVPSITHDLPHDCTTLPAHPLGSACGTVLATNTPSLAPRFPQHKPWLSMQHSPTKQTLPL